MEISIETLTTNEKIALGILEIFSIPDISIISEKINSTDEVIKQYKNEISSMLREIHQIYTSNILTNGFLQDISLELFWITENVVNQPYKAQIKLYVIIRTIDENENSARKTVSSLMNIIKSVLILQKYDVKESNYDVFKQNISKINCEKIKSIVKDEKLENLQNQLLPFCYSYDRIPISSDDLSSLVNILIDYPNSAVSLQIIPTQFEYQEMMEIDKVSQQLNILSKGIMDQAIGNISFTLSEKYNEIYKYYSDNKSSPMFLFNILVYGSVEASTSISSRLFGKLSSGEKATSKLKMVDLDFNEVNLQNNFYPVPWAINEILLNKGRKEEIWFSKQVSKSLYRLPYLITIEETVEFFRFPIGTERISAGINITKSEKGNKTYTPNIINSGDIIVGKLRSSTQEDFIGFSINDLAKHMLIVGTPGSGKTTFSISLLDRLWKNHKIPFLVIEPAKNEYRSLIQSIPEIQIFTPGKNFISPFVFNPFVPPKNVKLETYKSTLKTAFSAAVSMSTPLDKIFEETINNCYSDFRWLDNYTLGDKGQIFNISDFIKCFQETFNNIGYTGDAKNIGRAGIVRLKSLINLFDNYFSIPIEDILQKPTIIELAAIENSDQKALIISLLLLSILAYVNVNYIGEGGLKNVILLEEAHVLLDSSTNTGQGEANPSAIAQGLVKRMLAEIRSYGVGLIIADQSPRKVSTDVVALTDMKMIFRIVENTDKQIIADSTNMSDAQVQRIGRLKPGEAFLFFNKLDVPEEVVTPNYRLENNIKITLSDEGIKTLSTYWNNKREKLRPYPQCKLIESCSKQCDYEQRILAREIARRIFIKYFTSESKEIDSVIKVFGQISKLIKKELNDEIYSTKLLSCVKVHLWRKIKYETKIEIKNIIIENSLKKQNIQK